MYRSNIYYELRKRHILNLVNRYAWVALIGAVVWAGWVYQQMLALDYLVRPVIVTLN
jgi:hypothetical protein